MATQKIIPANKYEELVEGKFTETRVAAVQQAFKKFMLKIAKPKGSTEPDRMNTRDIGNLMRMLNLNPFESELQEMMKEIDPKNEGTINFYQFLFLLWRKTLSGEDEDILTAFQVFDTNKDGFISLEELKKLLIKVGEPFNDAELKAFCVNADINEDGRIDYVDFVNRMNVEEAETNLPQIKSKKSKRNKYK